MKKVAILGCTGSIGTTALNIIREKNYSVSLLVNNSELSKLKLLIAEFQPDYAICVAAKYFYCKGKDLVYEESTVSYESLLADSDIVINGIVGLSGLKPSLATLRAGKKLATANKESLVCAGHLINKEKKHFNGTIYPLDSEHSTIWQLIDGKESMVKRLILTASGGAFRDLSHSELKIATAKQALLHPNWIMGKKVTIDCATLMNKGMEIIEAQHLFNTKNISVIMHRESIIHSLVELNDNSLLAGLSTPDMTIPIQYALTYPNREFNQVEKLDLEKVSSLNFGTLDEKLFPCLHFAKEVAKFGDYAGTVLNAANEVMVRKYIEGNAKFYDISNGVEKALEKFGFSGIINDMEDVFCIDRQVKEYTLSIMDNLGE